MIQAVSNVSNASDIMRVYSENTRLNHAKAASKISDKVAEMDATEALNRIPDVLSAAKHAGIVHGWTQTSVQVGVRLDEIAKAASVQVNLPEFEE